VAPFADLSYARAVLRRLVLAAALLAVLLPGGVAAARPVPPFGHEGRWITDAQGRVVVLHGLNIMNKFAPYAPQDAGFGADDLRFLARHGFDTVRTGFILKGLLPAPGSVDAAYRDKIVALAGQAAAAGLFPLVDFHQDMYNERFNGEGFPDWMVQDDGLPATPDRGFPANYTGMKALQRAYDHFWADDPAPDGTGLQEHYAAAWQDAARALAGVPGVVGYDLFNEPFAGSVFLQCSSAANGGCAVERDALTGFHRKVIAAIRAVDPARLVFWEPIVNFNFGTGSVHGDTGDPAAAISFHLYCLFAQPGTTPSANARTACPGGERATLEQAAKLARRTGDASLLTEFGATDDLARLRSVVDLADQAMVGWQEWTYYGDDPCCKRPAEGLIRDLTKPPAGANVKAAKLDVLERAYPQAIAGTPTAWGYDEAAARFTLRYRTSARVAAGAATEISIPRDDFPHGYRVRVTGARVLSAPGATLLRLRNRAGARAVSVRVTRR
jgi:endoglycosylceramidase